MTESPEQPAPPDDDEANVIEINETEATPETSATELTPKDAAALNWIRTSGLFTVERAIAEDRFAGFEKLSLFDAFGPDEYELYKGVRQALIKRLTEVKARGRSR